MSEIKIGIELLALDSERFRAMVRQEFGTLERLLDDELVWTHASAVSEGKRSFLERLKAGSTVSDPYSASTQRRSERGA